LTPALRPRVYLHWNESIKTYRKTSTQSRLTPHCTSLHADQFRHCEMTRTSAATANAMQCSGCPKRRQQGVMRVESGGEAYQEFKKPCSWVAAEEGDRWRHQGKGQASESPKQISGQIKRGSRVLCSCAGCATEQWTMSVVSEKRITWRRPGGQSQNPRWRWMMVEGGREGGSGVAEFGARLLSCRPCLAGPRRGHAHLLPWRSMSMRLHTPVKAVMTSRPSFHMACLPSLASELLRPLHVTPVPPRFATDPAGVSKLKARFHHFLSNLVPRHSETCKKTTTKTMEPWGSVFSYEKLQL